MVLIVSSDAADIPVSLSTDGLAGYTATCVAVGTLAEDDGEVVVTLTDEQVDDDLLELAVETILDATAGFIRVETVLGHVLFSRSAKSDNQRVRVWVSNLIEPDEVVVELMSTR